MSVPTAVRPGERSPTKRARAAKVVESAARTGLIATVVAFAAWLIAGGLAATAFVILVVATLGAAAVLIWRGAVPNWVWLGLAIAWAVVLLERAVVQENGGIWVALAGWLGVIFGARRAGIATWALPLLAYPLVSAAIVVAADQPLDDPWSSSWLWVLAVLGPIIGARTLVRPPDAP